MRNVIKFTVELNTKGFMIENPDKYSDDELALIMKVLPSAVREVKSEIRRRKISRKLFELETKSVWTAKESMFYAVYSPKLMNLEIKRQLAKYDAKHKLELQALVLWQLHEQFGFGEKRLKRFYNNFDASIEALIGRYQLEDTDSIWLCTLKLKDIGIDIEEWDRQNR